MAYRTRRRSTRSTSARRRSYSSKRSYSRRPARRTARRSSNRRSSPQTVRIVIEQPAMAGAARPDTLQLLGETVATPKKAKLGAHS